eukprot:m.283816 g.283816  ORF g.283816 m.283816 type:complete len:87 (+) comp11120_c0_seq5:6171-6431(+)
MSEPTAEDYGRLAEALHGGLALYMPMRHSSAPPPYGGSMWGKAMAAARHRREQLGPPQFHGPAAGAPAGSGATNSRAKALAMLDSM